MYLIGRAAGVLNAAFGESTINRVDVAGTEKREKRALAVEFFQKSVQLVFDYGSGRCRFLRLGALSQPCVLCKPVTLAQQVSQATKNRMRIDK